MAEADDKLTDQAHTKTENGTNSGRQSDPDDLTYESLFGSENELEDEVSHSGRQSLDPMIGVTINDRYQIIRLIGKGGMASVYEGKHIVLKKRVAIKILPQKTALDNDAIVRFQQEASGLALLQHSNLVSISDFGLSESGNPYCVMDLVEGDPLSDLISQQRVPPLKQLSQIFSDITSALAYAHKKNVIHRDLKPSNIIICPQDDKGLTAKLIDFGIAKFGDRQNQALTRTGAVIGSPYYMSPEQCAGQKLDHRSDIYSLGCTMYEAVTGRPLFRGNTALQTLAKHSTEEATPPRLVRKDLPPGWDAIIMKCLAKQPEKRYQSTLDIGRDLSRVDCRTAGERQRNRWVHTGIALAIFGALAAGGLVAFNRTNSDEEQHILHMEDIDLVRQRIASLKSSQRPNWRLLAALYNRLVVLDVNLGENGTARQDSEEGYKLVSEPLRDVSYYSWHIAAYLGYLYGVDKNFEEGARCESKALDIFDAAMARHVPFKMEPTLLECLSLMLDDCLTRPSVDLKKVHTIVARAPEIWNQIISAAADRDRESNCQMASDIFMDLGAKCEKCDDLPDARACYQQAANISAKIPNEKKKKLAENQIAVLKKRLANPNQGNLTTVTPPLNQANNDVQNAAQNLANSQAQSPENIRDQIHQASRNAGLAKTAPEAFKYAETLYKLCQKYEPGTAEDCHATSFFALCQEAVNKSKAVSLAHDALALHKKLKLPGNDDAISAMAICIRCDMANGQMAEARHYIETYLDMRRHMYPNDPAREANDEMVIGYIWAENGHNDEAYPLYQKAKWQLEISGLTGSNDYKKVVEMLKTLKASH